MNTSEDCKWEDCVGPGWAPKVKYLVNLCELYDVPIGQVKEKFGSLRFYTDKAHPIVDQAISKIERECETICEFCGEPGKQRNLPWIKVLCDKHYQERLDYYENRRKKWESG